MRKRPTTGFASKITSKTEITTKAEHPDVSGGQLTRLLLFGAGFPLLVLKYCLEYKPVPGILV